MKLTKKKVLDTLKAQAFDPSVGVIKIIADVDDPVYFLQRAIEELNKYPNKESVTLAIQLLTLHLLKVNE